MCVCVVSQIQSPMWPPSPQAYNCIPHKSKGYFKDIDTRSQMSRTMDKCKCKHSEFPSIPSNDVDSVTIAASDSCFFVSDFKPSPRPLLFCVLLMRCPQSQHAQEATSIATEQCNIKVAFLLTSYIINSTWWTAENKTCLLLCAWVCIFHVLSQRRP